MASTSTYPALVLMWALWFSIFTCKLLMIVHGDHNNLSKMRAHQSRTRQQLIPIVVVSVSLLNHLSIKLCPSFLQYHWHVMYIMMMTSGVCKCVNTNFKAKCILFLGFWLVKSICRHWFLTLMIFCNFCIFFKFKVCIFIFIFFSSYGFVLELYCSCACNVIHFADISILKMNSLCTHRL